MNASETSQATHQLLSFSIADQLFGIPVLQVNDVLGPQKITRMPLAPPAIAGVMNLRGRIVTSVDVRRCLDLSSASAADQGMSIVVDYGEELFSLTIDKVGDVLNLSADSYEPTPLTLDMQWQNIASGIHKIDGNIMVVVDVERLLGAAGEYAEGQ